jgi:hypothetical protein
MAVEAVSGYRLFSTTRFLPWDWSWGWSMHHGLPAGGLIGIEVARSRGDLGMRCGLLEWGCGRGGSKQNARDVGGNRSRLARRLRRRVRDRDAAAPQVHLHADSASPRGGTGDQSHF